MEIKNPNSLLVCVTSCGLFEREDDWVHYESVMERERKEREKKILLFN